MGEGRDADRWKMFLKPLLPPSLILLLLDISSQFLGRCPVIDDFCLFSRTLPGGSEAAAGLQLQFTHSKILDWRWWDVTPGGNRHRGHHPLQQVCKVYIMPKPARRWITSSLYSRGLEGPSWDQSEPEARTFHLEMVYRHKEEHVALAVSSVSSIG